MPRPSARRCPRCLGYVMGAARTTAIHGVEVCQGCGERADTDRRWGPPPADWPLSPEKLGDEDFLRHCERHDDAERVGAASDACPRCLHPIGLRPARSRIGRVAGGDPLPGTPPDLFVCIDCGEREACRDHLAFDPIHFAAWPVSAEKLAGEDEVRHFLNQQSELAVVPSEDLDLDG